MTLIRSLSFVFVLIGFVFTAPAPAEAASKAKIDRRVDKALREFREDIHGASDLLAKAEGVLVFPSIKKGGFGIGGEYGQGALRINGRTAGYYSTAAASVGFQIGVQARRQILVFLDKRALTQFQNSKNFEIGVDGSVTVVTLGVGGEVDTSTINQPVVAFVFDAKGVMYNLSLEGTKITQIHDD